MYRLSFVILYLVSIYPILAQSPHGDELKIDCAKCHTSESWLINHKTIQFDHNTTSFELKGTHAQTECRLCHKTLIFNEAPTDCASCHNDVHSMSVGNDCERCHSTETWLVDNIPELHEQNGFPLVGSHGNLSCVECHLSETNLRFDRIGNECVSCHMKDYSTTQNPNHQTAGFSVNCQECHTPFGMGWDSDINHDFFPLTLGHDIQDCKECHTTTSFSDVSPECVSCHQNNYNQTNDPNHVAAGFPIDCASCHTTNPGWKPATFDHNQFPLTLGHSDLNCTQCHTTGNYSETSSECVNCHLNDYNNTTDPNHIASQFPTDCAACHTTNPGWEPATFNHDQFPLTLGHSGLNCTQCHTTSNYSETSAECVSCHLNDYNNTNDPNHTGAQFPTNCVVCHTTNPGWKPATFDHDGQYFPIYSGKHKDQWNSCTDCHANSSNYADFTCLTCHTNPQTDNDHSEVTNYVYASSACLQCHPQGSN